MPLTKEDITALAAPFSYKDVQWLTQNTFENKRNKGEWWAIVVPFLDSRVIQERLTDVVGTDWHMTLRPVNDTTLKTRGIICSLTVKGITRESIGAADVIEGRFGSPTLKTADTDSVKRAAVTFGIGAYFHKFDPQRLSYDPEGNFGRGQLLEVPVLPESAIMDSEKEEYRKYIEEERNRLRARLGTGRSPSRTEPRPESEKPKTESAGVSYDHVKTDVLALYAKYKEKDGGDIDASEPMVKLMYQVYGQLQPDADKQQANITRLFNWVFPKGQPFSNAVTKALLVIWAKVADDGGLLYDDNHNVVLKDGSQELYRELLK